MRTYNITSALHKILGFQAILKSPFHSPSIRAMSTTTPLDPDINRTLTYWFDGPDHIKKWFLGGPAIDAEIKEQFGSLVIKARSSELDTWAETPKGALALIIVTDQFPRNIFRGSALTHASDAHALRIASASVAKGFDREVSSLQQPFFYIPFMHDENLISQIASVALYDAALTRCEPGEWREMMQQNLHFAVLHRDVMVRFGRFPSRNGILGRETTEEERKYLEEHPGGF